MFLSIKHSIDNVPMGLAPSSWLNAAFTSMTFSSLKLKHKQTRIELQKHTSYTLLPYIPIITFVLWGMKLET